jgi:ATP-binding cassette subfamily C (CFTR/MRP) protein 1
LLAILTARRQKLVLESKDKRMRIMTETINSIKIIKLNSWIERFISNIKLARDREILMTFCRFMVSCINMLSIFLLPNILILIVFSVALGSGIRMRTSEAFAALQILNLLREPTRWLPFFVGLMMEFKVSMKRIQNFLQSEEINHLLIKNDTDLDNPNALTLQSSNFTWGGERIDSNDKLAEKEKELKKVQRETHKEIRRREKEEAKQNKPNRFRINDDFDEESKDILSDSSPSEDDTISSVSSSRSDIKVEMKVKDIVTLKNIKLNIEKGEFICIIGEIGAGKSSLINALMADLIYMSNETVIDMNEKEVNSETIEEIFDRSKKQGIIKSSGSVSYVQQVPWIQNMTLRDNILFGSELNEDKYNKTIEQCQLVEDFAQLEGGDLTEIGEKGINLSGGQKARVSLARAVYANKDIILMDDPISALDANTKQRIFDEVFEGELKNKTRILVTHAVDFLERFDRIVIMAHGKIKYMGTYVELKDKEEIQHIIETLKHVSEKEQEEEEHEMKEIELKKKTSSEEPNGLNIIADESGNDNDNNVPSARKMSYMSTKSSKIITDEHEEKADVNWIIYVKFFLSNHTWIVIVLVIPLFTLYAYAGVQATRYIGVWVDHVEDDGSFERYLWIILGYSLAVGFAVTIGFFIIMVAVLRTSNILHRRMIDKTLRAPINLYYDKTPTGKILNRFSKDINKLDFDLPFTITFTIECLSWICASLYVSALVSPWSLTIAPFAAIAGVLLVRFYIRSWREMIRIENVTSSPILSNFAETVSGATTIRCFKKQQDFIKRNHRLVDDNLNSMFWMQSINLWCSIRLQYISSLMMLFSLAFCIAFKYSADVSTVGTLLIYLLTLQGNILWFFRIACEVEGAMVSYDRCNQILEIPQEQFNTHPKPPSNWPSQGKISFKNFNLRYRPETELVLKNLSFEIDPKQKIGVVGRTGAGKSTVCLALCRIVEADSGDIIIDGLSLKNVDIATVREKITIIPQDPNLFEGSLKFNLDPENKCTDVEILGMVSKAMLQDLWDSNKEIAQNGENLSSGEKQLICICRAILRKNKIILMDEATANIDIKTEEIIQKLITEEFKDSTVITIAHRLNTIQSCDKVIILEKGQVVQRDIKDFREYFA